MKTKIKVGIILLLIVAVIFNPLLAKAEQKQMPWWTLNPMEILCKYTASPVFYAPSCTMVLISHIVNNPKFNNPPEIPADKIPVFHDEMADDGYYCTGGCLGDFILKFNDITTFTCPNDSGISVYFNDGNYHGYLTKGGIENYAVKVNGTFVGIDISLIADLDSMANPSFYSVNVYCKTPRN